MSRSSCYPSYTQCSLSDTPVFTISWPVWRSVKSSLNYTPQHLFSLKKHKNTLIQCFVHASTDSSYLKYFFPKFIKSKLYNFCYTTHGQKISICNYWNGKQMCHFHTTIFSLSCISFDLLWIFYSLPFSLCRSTPKREILKQQHISGSTQWRDKS